MCGGSVSKITSSVSKAVKGAVATTVNVGTGGLVKRSTASTLVDKGTSVAVNTAAGFAAGGFVGAAAAGGRSLYQNTKTGKAKTLNLRTVGQAAVTGFAAGAVGKAAGIGLKAAQGGLVASGQTVATGLGTGQVAAYTAPTSIGSILTGAVGKAASWAAKGGLVNSALNLGTSLIKGAPRAVGEVIGDTGNAMDNAGNVADSLQNAGRKALNGYNKFRSNLPNNIQNSLPDAESVDSKIRNAVSDATRGLLPGLIPQANSPGVTVEAPQPSNLMPIALVVGGIAAFLLLKKGGKVF